MESNNDGAYPSEHYERLERTRRRTLITLLLLGMFFCVLIYWLFYTDESVFSIALFSAIALFWCFLTISEYRGISEWPKITRIVPYFDEAVSGEDTFFHSGHAIARNCRFLDRIATEQGLMPLSTFGFEDDYLNEERAQKMGTMKWYDPTLGLTTINGLLDNLSKLNKISERPDVKADLERLKAKLEQAEQQRVKFCFHLRIDSAYTGLEFDNRVGRYFPTWKDREPSPEV